MAVEARHLNLFPSQQLFCNNSEIMNPVQGNGGMYGAQIGYGVPMMTGGLVATEALLPAYNNNSMMNDSMLPKTTAMQSDSGLTYNVPISTSLSRKRSRVDSINPNPNLFSYPTPPASHHYKNSNNSFSFLGEDISLQIQQQQFDIDRIISQHMEKVRLEIEEKRKRQARRIIESIEMGMMKRLRAKEVEIEKIGKMNWALEEKVKSLCIENQIWRDLAQTNEATANALRTNLEQVLAQVKDEPNHNNQNDAAAAMMDDAQSCCGSTGNDDGWRAVEEGTSGGSGSGLGSRWCRNCGKEESCVLLLPCRHLCLCTVCGSSLHTCPVCKSTKNASVHVNLS
ncbi:PREDICTED: probable BOI-related E3 ubiquitin-protein ligase 3 [Fragaria vesca subsp. vesca]|uniref:probable BOI-related E3 ubiquitin-protein ligase 3 n=1 Tax=Fragaria vesca subsp. vesca TaxID=101020 RepID=UPI0002C32924|nr:PREDICTED: probable BOI-related E3 ubiquitin-protein ligase 3 [Fragaria vesca subsp. vesca]